VLSFARGSADDKGQFFMHVKAFEAMMKTNSLPCNIKFIIEGEEEVGSVSLADFLEENKEKLACDVILISDTHIYSNEQPTVTTGLRGLSYLEVEVEGRTEIYILVYMVVQFLILLMFWQK
jgi:acetylornithine deacetylase/succinyl-diaminopimelate desuccinylase-like protein